MTKRQETTLEARMVQNLEVTTSIRKLLAGLPQLFDSIQVIETSPPITGSFSAVVCFPKDATVAVQMLCGGVSKFVANFSANKWIMTARIDLDSATIRELEADEDATREDQLNSIMLTYRKGACQFFVRNPIAGVSWVACFVTRQSIAEMLVRESDRWTEDLFLYLYQGIVRDDMSAFGVAELVGG